MNRLFQTQKKYFSTARQALRSKKKTLDKTEYIVTSDFYRLDIGILAYRPAIHYRMDPIEKENLLLEYEMAMKEEQTPTLDPCLFEMSLTLPIRLTPKEDLWSTHYKQLKGEELAQQREEDALRDQMYGSLNNIKRKDVDAEGKQFIPNIMPSERVRRSG
jgi:hypothetical protein